MAISKSTYACNECGALSPKWIGQCHDCTAWNSFTEIAITTEKVNSRFCGYAGETQALITPLNKVVSEIAPRVSTGLEELDRVLGGGLVSGMVVLIGGDPGIGKSTVLLQSLASLKGKNSTLYVTGEESLAQVSLRAKRLDLADSDLNLLAETRVERIISLAEKHKPDVMVIDSIQTLYTEVLQAAPGSVSQVRESAAQLVRFSKRTGVAVYLVGHVTKDGTLAGPRVLEHMVDAVLYFEGQQDSRFRIIRAIKNRFGAINEMGIFGMTDKGLKGINNPSALLLSRDTEPVAGSVVMVSWEGSRPILLEVQALVDDSPLANPRRVTVGIEPNRLAMLLAVLHRHGGLSVHQLDIFLNVVGGVKISETGSDLAVLFAVLSSFKNKPLDPKLVVFGEVGLGGEIRPVQSGQERIKEAQKHGFTRAIVPKGNAPKGSGIMKNIEVVAVSTLQEAISNLF